MRATPFGLVFADLAAERFPAVREVLARESISSADRDHFILLEPVGRLLREMVPPDAGADTLEAHALLLHHAYRHWAGSGWVYRIGKDALARATTGRRLTSYTPRPAFYVQLPELRVWGTPSPDGPPEPLDGVFVSETAVPGGIAALAIFGMRPDRPGFSAVGLEGRADPDDPAWGEIEIATTFEPTITGGEKAGLYSLGNVGELLLLVCRLLALLPVPGDGSEGAAEGGERVVDV